MFKCQKVNNMVLNKLTIIDNIYPYIQVCSTWSCVLLAFNKSKYLYFGFFIPAQNQSLNTFTSTT